MKAVNQADVITFLKEDIIHRLGLPETITVDRGTVFMGDAIQSFVNNHSFKFTHSTPYFAQANGQAEASNKVLKGNLEKMITDNHRE